MNEHQALVYKLNSIIDHPNANNLKIFKIEEFQVIYNKNDFKTGDLVIYIEPDTICSNRPEFEFLGSHRRIKTRKLRGEWSIGLLIPAPPGAKIGEDYFVKLGLEHWEPQIHGNFTTGGDNIKLPKQGDFPKYDVLNFRKYSGLFNDGEEVIVTEKLHGCNSRFTCIDDRIYCGSRRFWKKEDPSNLWWKALARCDVLEAWLRHNQDLIVYGEIFGQVQNLKYGAKNGEIFFAVFDIRRGSQWLDFDEAHKTGASLPWVPLVFRGKYNKEQILTFAEGDSLYPFAQNIREGVVVKPVHERTDRRIGRVQLKVVGNRYLSKN